MLETKIFKIPEDIKEFNEFVPAHPPTGTNGMKVLPEYVMLTFENGKLMSKEEKITHLIGELNTLAGNEVDEIRQFKDGINTIDFIDFYTQRNDWKAFHKNLTPMKKMCEMTKIKMDVIVETLGLLGKKVEIEHPTIPELPPEPIIAKTK